MKLTHARASVLFALVVLVGGALWYSKGTDTTGYSDTDSTFNVAYWTKQFERKDPTAVFAEFKKRNESAPFDRQHLSAHVMGDLIYATLGVEGVAVCDATFSFGCYHGFFARAISEGGEARVKELDTACVTAFGPLGTGCQHGIGHGVLEYVGYDRVNDALALCKQTTQAAPLLGCATGVFMEFNAPLTGVGTGLVPKQRELTPETMYEPCPTVPAEFRPACYYQLGQIIATNLHDDLPNVEHICGTLAGESRSRCFLGVGEGLTYRANYQGEKVKEQCGTFSESGDELSCRAGASWALYAEPTHRGEASVLCAYASTSQTNTCLALADLTEGQTGH
jgi:hypothetical protein